MLGISAYSGDYDGYYLKAYMPTGGSTTSWAKVLRVYNVTEKVTICPQRACDHIKKDCYGQLNNYDYTAGSSFYRPIKITNYYSVVLKNLSKVYLCGDALHFYLSGTEYRVWGSTPTSASLPNLPLVHNNGANVLFWDGHAEWKNYADKADIDFIHPAGW
jgi:prepilin-type processing-associated H-X9-DG protein